MARSGVSLEVEVISANTLSAGDIQAWSNIQSSEPAFNNPLFGPHFCLAVGAVREDARVAIYRRDGQPVAFFPHHRRPGNFGRPIGAPFSDYHGVVSDKRAGLESPQLLRLAGLSAFRHNGLIDPHAIFPTPGQTHEAYAIELSGAPEDYLEAVRAASPKKFKNYRRLQHRLAELGPLRLEADRSPPTFDQLLAWKSAQFRRTGLQDVLRPAWTRRLMRNLFETIDGPMAGLMLTLHAGDTLVAGHFGIRANGVYHPWIASANPALSAFSPGQAFLDQAIRAMPGLGLQTYDLGPGHDHYKRGFASTTRSIGSGMVSVVETPGYLGPAGERPWAMVGRGRSAAAVDRVRRRLDHIAVVDPSVGGRMRGLVEAVVATRHRSLGADAQAAQGR